MVMWSMKIAGNLKKLEVRVDHLRPGMLPQMLSMAAIFAPNLQRLIIYSGADQPVMHSLAFLSQIKELTLDDWKFPEDNVASGIKGLSGLRSLEVRPRIKHDAFADAHAI